jgi:hypothetical protein
MSDIFVFGSNLAGRHGKGAALYAKRVYGAKRGIGQGLTGRSYAIPTKGFELEVLPLWVIEAHINTFVQFARDNPRMKFLLTPIGCGLAGYTVDQIKPLFIKAGLPENVTYSVEWRILEEAKK